MTTDPDDPRTTKPRPESSINFSTLNRDGTVTNERSIKRSTIAACPHFILLPEHYRDDGTCRCDEERAQRLANRRPKPRIT